MSSFYYSVTATFPDRATADSFIAWLVEGHIADVIRGGAESGRVIALDGEPTEDGGASIRVETQYP